MLRRKISREIVMASTSAAERPPRPPLYQPLNISGWTVLITGMQRRYSSWSNPRFSEHHVQERHPYTAGASSGFGEAMAWRFAEAGCSLVLLARRLDRLESLRDQLQFTYHVPVHTIQLDVRNLAEVDLLPQQLPPEFAEVRLRRRKVCKIVLS